MSKQVFNPYLPDYEYIPDGEPYIFGERLYIYGSHDRFNGKAYCENDYVCWSAPVDDLSEWRYEGEIYRVIDHPLDESHIRTQLYAPDITRGLDGKYYLYYSMASSGIMSVAVSDTPCGKFRYYGDVHDKDGNISGLKSGEHHHFDPGIMVDDDGRIYMYSGFGPGRDTDDKGRTHLGCYVTELEKDMVTIKSGPSLIIPKTWKKEEKAAYFEAPSIRKINGVYYLVYSARCTGLYYYYSDYPDKDFKFGGRIHSTSDYGLHGHDEEKPAYPIGNIHGGIVCIKGQYYIFDHRHTNGTGYCRQGVAEPIFFDENKKIHQAEATSCGLNNGPLIASGKYPASICCNLMQKDLTDGKAYISQDIPDVTDLKIVELQNEKKIIQYVKNLTNDSLIGYKYFHFNKIVDEINIEVRGNFDGTIKMYLMPKEILSKNIDISEWDLLSCTDYCFDDRINISSTEWININYDINVSESGIEYAVYFVIKGEGKLDFKSFSFINA